MVVLDATAGNRLMWKNKKPPLTVFMDRRCTELNPKPDVQAVWGYLPFRNDVFNCVIFDPPHLVRSSPTKPNSIARKMIDKFGVWKRKKHIMPALYKALKEFARCSDRLCFKWYEDNAGLTMWQVYPIFRGLWSEVYRRTWKSRGLGKNPTYWITFSRSSLSSAK